MESFTDLVNKISQSKAEFEILQKEIETIREQWMKEQKDHEIRMSERDQQEEIARKREEETYRYETNLARKRMEDEFTEKRMRWEKELLERKEEIENDKKELDVLRKQVAGFEGEKEKAVKEAVALMQKEVTTKFETERKLREQEFHSERDLLSLRLESFTNENARLGNEVAAFKKALEEATKQVKDIAVKVIESSGSAAKITAPSDS